MKKKLILATVFVSMAAMTFGCNKQIEVTSEVSESESVTASSEEEDAFDPSVYTEEYCRQILNADAEGNENKDTLWFVEKEIELGRADDSNYATLWVNEMNVPGCDGTFEIHTSARLTTVVNGEESYDWIFGDTKTTLKDVCGVEDGEYTVRSVAINDYGDVVVLDCNYVRLGDLEDPESQWGTRSYVVDVDKNIEYTIDCISSCFTDGGYIDYYRVKDADGNIVFDWDYAKNDIKASGFDYSALKKQAEKELAETPPTQDSFFAPEEEVTVGDDKIVVSTYYNLENEVYPYIIFYVDGVSALEEKLGYQH